ncbi:MAG TPA: AAA family ATPase [Vicinamibacterales bacterium]|nr:AAA family ATPase [Vicinamibacterales bacterium]
MFLRSVELTNVRCIRSLSLPLETSSGVPRRWTLLLGENGVGKSTLMRSVGLVLAGSSALAELLGDPESWIRAGEAECTISAEFETAEGDQRHASLRIRRGDTIKEVYETNKETLELLDRAIARSARNYLVIAYGASRRLSSAKLSTQPVSSRFQHARANNVATLFSPDAMLNPLETWAIDLHYRLQDEGLRIVDEAMRKLLPGMTFKGIDRDRRDLLFDTVDGEVPLAYLSDGYQNMAAWCGDLLFRVTSTFEDYRDPLSSRGVLLVDEIDLHLHPVWQRQLRNFLTDMFPNFQFIVSTHSVLTAQQAGEGELFVMRRPQPTDAPVLDQSPIEPRTLMVHQLLMSPVFGLETMESVAVETMKKDYVELRDKKKRTPDEESRFVQLKEALQDLPDWSQTPKRDLRQQKLLRDIKTALDRTPPAATKAKGKRPAKAKRRKGRSR